MPSSMETGVKGVHITGTDGQVPTQLGSQFTPQVKEASAANVNAGVASILVTVDMDGFSKLGIDTYGSTGHDHKLTIWASPDGTIQTGSITSATGNVRGRNAVVEVPSAYALIEITNNDVASRTYDIWSRKFN